MPEKVTLAKEVPLALVRATTVFISYLSAMYVLTNRSHIVLNCAASSQDVASERNQKTISATHVLDAVKLLEWQDGSEVHRHLEKELAGQLGCTYTAFLVD